MQIGAGAKIPRGDANPKLQTKKAIKLYTEMMKEVENVLPSRYYTIYDFNDADHTRKRSVMALLRRAARKRTVKVREQIQTLTGASK